MTKITKEKDETKTIIGTGATSGSDQAITETVNPQALVGAVDPGETPVEDLQIIDPELLAQFAQEFEGLANEIQMGFGSMVAAGKVAKDDRPFFVINGASTDFLNTKTGELEVKQVFQLQFPTGEVVTVMQSNANIRAKYARLFITARLARQACVIGPMKYVERGQPVAGNMPVIFEQQPGFKILRAVPGSFFDAAHTANA